MSQWRQCALSDYCHDTWLTHFTACLWIVESRVCTPHFKTGSTNANSEREKNGDYSGTYFAQDFSLTIQLRYISVCSHPKWYGSDGLCKTWLRSDDYQLNYKNIPFPLCSHCVCKIIIEIDPWVKCVKFADGIFKMYKGVTLKYIVILIQIALHLPSMGHKWHQWQRFDMNRR